MENTESDFKENPENNPREVETDYPKHQDDPGPSPQDVNEDNDKGAGPVIKWGVPIIILILLIYWLFLRK